MESITAPAKAVLEHVPRIHFYEGGPRCPEDICYPSVMRAVLEYLGENLGCKHCKVEGTDWGLGCSYSYFMGISGNGVLMSWLDGWQENSFNMEFLPGDLLEPYRWTFKSIGYGVQIYSPQAGEEAMRQVIIHSITQKRRPVIGFGIVGPPEPVIITGYDEHGDVLIGWSFFQNMPEFSTGLEYEGGAPDHYFRKRGWFPETQRLLVLGDKGQSPDQGPVLIESLRYALTAARTPHITRGGLTAHTGLNGYTAWAADLLRRDFDGLDEAAMQQRFRAHDFQVGNVAEARWYAALWLANTFERVHYNMAEDLLKAAGCLAGEHQMMWNAWDLCGGNGNPDGWHHFADSLVRAQLAAVVIESGKKYREAVEHIERALNH